jgi:hypothetical protein
LFTEPFEVSVEVKDVDTGALGGSGYRQVRQRVAVGSVRAGSREFSHRRQDHTLHAAIHGDLAQAFQGALHCRDVFLAASVDHELVAHRPAPTDVAALDGSEQKVARS